VGRRLRLDLFDEDQPLGGPDLVVELAPDQAVDILVAEG
jgi:hypothetical protein